MAYSDFNLDTVAQVLGVGTQQANLFPGLTPAEPSAWLTETLAMGGQGSQLSLLTEKSRSEFVVMPVLLAARRLSGDRFAIYSGLRLDVDSKRGLLGECDFILAAQKAVLHLQAPVAAIVEAKKNDIEAGLGQCIAQMVAADQFNRSAGRDDLPVFGCVTTGETWQFLKLAGPNALIHGRRFYIDNLEMILGALQAVGGGPA